MLLLLDSANRNLSDLSVSSALDLILDNLNLHNAQNAVYDYLLTDILNGALRDGISAIADRVKHVGLSLHADYVLMMLRFEDSNSVPVRFIINSLAMLLPSAKVFFLRRRYSRAAQLHDLSKENIGTR